MNDVHTAAATRTTRRAARRTRVQHLITADEHSLAEVEALLATLPLCTAGRVFIEVPDSDAISVVSAPPRMTVSWLPRTRRDGFRRPVGELLARAATAWADEMLCDEGVSAQITLLGGFLSTADIVEHLTDTLGVELGSIHAPERYRLLER